MVAGKAWQSLPTSCTFKMALDTAAIMKRVQRYSKSLQLNSLRSKAWLVWTAVALSCFCFVALTRGSGSESIFLEHEDVSPELRFLYQQQQREETLNEEPKLILFWTKYHSSSTFDFGFGSGPFESAGCAVQDCRTTSDRSLLNQSHAVIFHALDFNSSDIPPYRNPSQRWVFYTLTSPANTPDDPKLWKVPFNWTMTYRRDSDIFQRHPYGSLESRTSLRTSYGKNPASKSKLPWLNVYQKYQKKKHVALFTSTCKTDVGREMYVRELAKYIPVDTYGACGQSCGSLDQCLTLVRKNYKFFLAFENSLCADYVTDKMYVALENDVVPIVYGEADYSVLAPIGSFINARAFDSPRALADYLWIVSRNEKLYRSFFDWRIDFQVNRYPNDGWCQLCQMLHDPDIPAQSYSNIYEWWMEGSNCAASYSFGNDTLRT